MFCSFAGKPTIVRLHGVGRTVLPDDPGFDEALAGFGEAAATRRTYIRSVIVVDVMRVSDSCGYGVPRMELVEERPTLDAVWRTRDEARVAAYQSEKNGTSLDGLPGLTSREQLSAPPADPPVPRPQGSWIIGRDASRRTYGGSGAPADDRAADPGAERHPSPARFRVLVRRRDRGAVALHDVRRPGGVRRGEEHVPQTGGALLACNHVSDVDPIYDVAFAISHGRMPRFLAKAELWTIPVVRSVMAGGGHIPVHRTRPCAPPTRTRRRSRPCAAARSSCSTPRAPSPRTRTAGR